MAWQYFQKSGKRYIGKYIYLPEHEHLFSPVYKNAHAVCALLVLPLAGKHTDRAKGRGGADESAQQILMDDTLEGIMVKCLLLKFWKKREEGICKGNRRAINVICRQLVVCKVLALRQLKQYHARTEKKDHCLIQNRLHTKET